MPPLTGGNEAARPGIRGATRKNLELEPLFRLFSTPMLACFSRPVRVKVAIALALIYSFCALAPGSALAFIDPARAVHCLIDDLGAAGAHERTAAAHVHANGVVHPHDDGGGPPHKHYQGQSRASDCCWLFSMSALARDPGVTFGVFSRMNHSVPDAGDALSGRCPDQINRPPIS
jgi:hypothetical protein